MKKRVLGCLPYLNLRPLIRSLERETPQGYELIYQTPALLAKGLQAGTCDIAAVSAFEALRNPDLVILPKLAIASDGEVASVLLFSRVPFDQIKSVALDTSSLSGAALVQILLSELYGISPTYVRADPDQARMRQDVDGYMLIGNNAMLQARDGLHVLDLGAAWKRLTGLSFVFGVWAARKTAVDAEDVAILQQARDRGLRELDEIAVEESAKLELPVAVVRNYLGEIMVYDLGEAQLAGLREYCRLAQAHGLLDSDADIRLWQGVESCDRTPRQPHSL